MVNQKGKMNKIVEIKIKKNEKYKQTRKETKQRAEARRFILLFIYLLFIYYMIGGRKVVILR